MSWTSGSTLIVTCTHPYPQQQFSLGAVVCFLLTENVTPTCPPRIVFTDKLLAADALWTPCTFCLQLDGQHKWNEPLVFVYGPVVSLMNWLSLLTMPSRPTKAGISNSDYSEHRERSSQSMSLTQKQNYLLFPPRLLRREWLFQFNLFFCYLWGSSYFCISPLLRRKRKRMHIPV